MLRNGDRQLATAYIGGGTPSLLEPELIASLVKGTVGRLDQSSDLEFTAEANPESLDEAKVAAWQQAGINRISLGVQSLKADVLAQLGRSCNPETARRGLRLAVHNFSRVSADWIIGPGLKKESLLDELTEAVDLGVEHFSVYILEVHPGTALKRDLVRGKVKPLSDSVTEDLYLAAGAHLESLGIRQYEVANFSRMGQESRHNQNYWKGVPYLALGPSAHGYWGRRRYANHSKTAKWSQVIRSGSLPEADIDALDLAARRLEKAILALRTRSGLPLGDIPEGTFDLARGQDEGLWELADGRLVLTRLGFLRIDSLEERLVARI